MKKRTIVLTSSVILLLILADHISKWCAMRWLQPVGVAPFIPGFMQLRYVLNDGAAFSMFSGKQTMLIIVTAVALTAMLVVLFRWKTADGWSRWGLVLIIGGGIGNLIDRIVSGQVVDFFEVTFVQYAVFNVADCFVTVGCVMLFIGILFAEKLSAKSKKAVQETPASQQQEAKPVEEISDVTRGSRAAKPQDALSPLEASAADATVELQEKNER